MVVFQEGGKANAPQILTYDECQNQRYGMQTQHHRYIVYQIIVESHLQGLVAKFC